MKGNGNEGNGNEGFEGRGLGKRQAIPEEVIGGKPPCLSA